MVWLKFLVKFTKCSSLVWAVKLALLSVDIHYSLSTGIHYLFTGIHYSFTGIHYSLSTGIHYSFTGIHSLLNASKSRCTVSSWRIGQWAVEAHWQSELGPRGLQIVGMMMMMMMIIVSHWHTLTTRPTTLYKKLIRRWDSERELSLRRHRTRATKYNRLLHKFHHSSMRRLCVGTYVYQIQWNNAM